TTTVCARARYRSMMGSRTSSHPSALWTLPGRSLAANAVALRVEHEEGVIADRLEVAVVRRLLLGAVNWALGTVDVEGHASGPGRCALHQLRIETREPLVVPFLREDVRLEPMECRGKREARLP